METRVYYFTSDVVKSDIMLQITSICKRPETVEAVIDNLIKKLNVFCVYSNNKNKVISFCHSLLPPVFTNAF